jgi:hypothetical protein
MKIIFPKVLACLLLVWGATGCSKDSAEPQEEFFVKAQKDEQPWEKTGEGYFTKATKEFSIYSPDTIPLSVTESFQLRFALPNKQVLSSVQALPANWIVLVGGDGVINSFISTEDTGLPAIQITKLDTVQKIVEGRFEAVLRRKASYTQQTELMKFTNGSFRVRYKELP